MTVLTLREPTLIKQLAEIAKNQETRPEALLDQAVRQFITPTASDRTESFLRQLTSIENLLVSLENEWENELIRDLFSVLLQTDLRALWHLTQPPNRMLCAMLQLSAGHLQPEKLSHAQIAAIRFVLEQIARGAVTEADMRICHERLTAAGLPPSLALGEKTVQSYVRDL